MAELGHQVAVLDIDEGKVASLRDGNVPFYEKGMDESLNRHLREDNLRFSTELAEAIPGADFVFSVCSLAIRTRWLGGSACTAQRCRSDRAAPLAWRDRHQQVDSARRINPNRARPDRP